MTSLLRKPLLGGVFGQGRFELASQTWVSNGLHALRFMVIEPRVGRVLAIADSKTAALDGARTVLRAVRAANDEEPQWSQALLWPGADLSVINGHAAAPPRAVPRRRREIFVRSGGCCRYCGKPLKLDGDWHIEHQMPRALGGSDDAMNLVASCSGCNLQKGARTALEYLVDQATNG